MIMRWIFAIFLVFVGFYLLRGSSLRQVAIRRVLFFFFIVSGFVSLIFADYWTKVSEKLGVGSGTALLTYIVTFAFTGFVISNYRWRQEQEERIVEIARKIALSEDD